MAFPNCNLRGHMHIDIYQPNIIFLSRCCTKPDAVAAKTLEDYLKTDVYEWCLSNMGKNPYPLSLSCPYFPGELCDYTQDGYTDRIEEVEVALSHACNLRCPMCFVPQHKDTKGVKDAYFFTLNSLKGHNLPSLRLTDRGEPFFYKNDTIKFLSNLKKGDFGKIRISSNLTLLNEDDINKLKSCEVPLRIDVSLDSLKPEVFKEIRTSNDFDKVIKNIFLLRDIGVEITIHSVIQQLNKNEIPDIKRWAEKNGFKFSYGVLDGERTDEVDDIIKML